MKRFIPFNGVVIDIEFFFQNPDLIENELVYAIRNRDKNLCDMVSSFIINVNMKIGLYVNEHHIRVEKNMPAIIDLIWAKHWETEEWDNEAIFEEDFKKICRTPFYIPFICMELLSGEYIMHLLHPDTLKLTYRTTCPLQEAGESDDMYKTRCNAEILKRKHGNLDTWLGRFAQTLSVSFDQIFPDKNKRGRQRAGTIGYQFFEEYGYATYEINKDDGKTAHALNLLERYDEPYVNNIGQIVFGQDAQVLEHCDGLLLFKTILFQHLRESDYRSAMAMFIINIQRLVRETVRVKNRFESYLADISERRKLSSASEDSRYREQMENAANWMMDEIHDIQERQEGIVNANKAEGTDESCPVIEMNPDSLYETVLWRILLLETRAIFQTIENTFSATVKSHSEIEKLHQYLRMNPTCTVCIHYWNDFKQLFSEQLSEFFPETEDNDLKQLWLLAIKAIIYCDPKRFHFMKSNGVTSLREINIPKNLSEDWLQKMNVDPLPSGGLLATMLLLHNARMYKVKLKEVRILQQDGSVIRKKVYHQLLLDASDEENTLYSVMKNLTPEKCTPALILQMRQLTREYTSGYKLGERELLKSREVWRKLWRIFRQTAEQSDSFASCRGGMYILIDRIEKILQAIEKEKMKMSVL